MREYLRLVGKSQESVFADCTKVLICQWLEKRTLIVEVMWKQEHETRLCKTSENRVRESENAMTIAEMLQIVLLRMTAE